MATPTFRESTLLRTNDIAHWLGIHPRTIRLWAECGEIPAIKIGKQWRFRRIEVTAWLSSRVPCDLPNKSRGGNSTF